MNYNDKIIDDYREQLIRKSKQGMIRRYFHYNKGVHNLELPLFSESSGKKEIIPMRNSQCLKPTCLYDIEEVCTRYARSNYSTYLNFICVNCRKLIDICNFYRDEEFQNIIHQIWQKYNQNSVQCTSVCIFSDGSWEPVLPEYVKRLYKKMINDKDKNKNKDSVIELTEDVPEEITTYGEFPMLDEFDVEEYALLWHDQVEDTDEPLRDNDILLRRYDLSLKWGEFMHVKNQTAFLQSSMGIFIKYLDQYFTLKKQRIGIIANYKTAFIAVKVTNYDRYNQKAFYYFIADNLEGPKGNPAEYDIAIVALHYDERWVAQICSFQEKKLKQIDYLEDTISRTTQDEIYELGTYLIEQIFHPFKFPKIGSTEQLNQLIKEQQRADIQKRVQYYSDCGHHIAQYLFNYVQDELEQIQLQLQWPQEHIQQTRFHNVKIRQGDKDYFITKLCWMFLKMAEDKGVKVKVYNQQPKMNALPKDEALESYIDEYNTSKLKQQWEINDNPAQIKRKQTIQVSKKLGTLVDQLKPNKPANVQKQISKINQYWEMESNGNRNNNGNGQQQQNRNNDELSQKSFKVDNITMKSNDISHLQSFSQDQTIQEIASQLINKKQPNQQQNQQPYQQAKTDRFAGHNASNNNSNNKPFLMLPKQELQRYLKEYKDKIVKEYRQQAIVKGYFNQQLIASHQVTQQQAPQEQQSFNLSGLMNNNNNLKDQLKLSQNQYDKLLLNLDQNFTSEEDKQIQRLQRELGLSDQELANLDAYQYKEMLDMVELMEEDQNKGRKRKRKPQRQANGN